MLFIIHVHEEPPPLLANVFTKGRILKAAILLNLEQ